MLHLYNLLDAYYELRQLYPKKATQTVTEPFGSMKAAEEDSLKQFSESKGRVNSAGLVQLFAWSDEFTLMNTQPYGNGGNANFKPAPSIPT